jgi:hypothetical protein
MIRIVLAIASLLIVALDAYGQDFGRFTGGLIFRFGADGRTMILQVPFGYIDPVGRVWDVPPGTETDGASIPWPLWSIIGAPFEGKYRDAAVVHDYFCQVQSRPWRETHLVFVQAMRAAGVGERQAKLMYAGVYYFGPRWGIGVATRGPGAEVESIEQQKEMLKALDDWIGKENPDIPEIGRQLDTGRIPNL